VRRGCFVSTQTNRVVARIALRTPTGDGFGAADVQIDGGAVWVVGDTGVLRIDSRHNAAGRFVPVTDARGEAPHGTAVAAGSAWAFMLDGRILRFDASSGRTAGTLRVRRPPGSGLFRGHPGTLTMIGTKQVAALDPEKRPVALADHARGRRPLVDRRRRGLWMYVARQPLARDRLVGLGARSGRRLSRVQLPESNVTGMATVGRDDWIATSTGKLVVVRR
jgi:hypothetical protein